MNLKRAAKLSDLTRLMSEEGAELPAQEPSKPMFQPVVQLHDEIFFEMGVMSYEEIRREIERSMVEAFGSRIDTSNPWLQAMTNVMSERTAQLYELAARVHADHSQDWYDGPVSSDTTLAR